MPNGTLIVTRVHPDDNVYHIKEAVLEKATTDGEERPPEGWSYQPSDEKVQIF